MQIVVEHFRLNVAHLLDGRAEAIVVTDSRRAAVRWTLASDRYVKRQGYDDVASLVAFSGEVINNDIERAGGDADRIMAEPRPAP